MRRILACSIGNFHLFFYLEFSNFKDLKSVLKYRSFLAAENAKKSKHRFHGTPFWRRKQEFQEGASERSQPMPKENDHQSEQGDPANSQSESECSKETASERKLRTVTPTHSVEE